MAFELNSEFKTKEPTTSRSPVDTTASEKESNTDDLFAKFNKLRSNSTLINDKSELYDFVHSEKNLLKLSNLIKNRVDLKDIRNMTINDILIQTTNTVEKCFEALSTSEVPKLIPKEKIFLGIALGLISTLVFIVFS